MSSFTTPTEGTRVFALANLYQRAHRLYETGDLLAALRLLQSHLARDPHDAKAFELKGIIHHALCEYRAARVSIEAAGWLRPLSSIAQLILADCYGFTNKVQLAQVIYLKLFEQATSDSPEDATSDDELQFPSRFTSALALGLGRVGEYDRALELCRKASHRSPHCHHAKYGVAFYMSRCGYPSDAIIAVLKEVVDLAPENFHYRMALTSMLCRQGQLDRAYLAIADATNEELESISCCCCLARLMSLYQNAGDTVRWCLCLSRLKHAQGSCQGTAKPAWSKPTEEQG